MSDDVLFFLAEEVEKGKKCALLTVTAACGSTPGSVGQVMAVTLEGASGTVGGGAGELLLIKRARDAIEEGESFFNFAFSLSEAGMVCGGDIAGFATVWGARRQLVIFGGGHIAQALAPIAGIAGFSVTVVDERPEMEGFFAGCRFVCCKPEGYPQVPIDKNAYAVICTHGHSRDQEALAFCLGKPLAYLGMIGSKKKIAMIYQNLGLDSAAAARVYAPIGLDIASEAPGEIAAGIVAQMLLVKNKGSLRHKNG
ncbi:MAG: XdhC/CoxI family protein [Spirochaetes bacterium]|nr:XdhC/CoxI family protein [Spirochaetota bacterium]